VAVKTIDDTRVCASCVGDRAIAADIATAGISGRCDYCLDEGLVTTFEDLATQVDDAYKEFVEIDETSGSPGMTPHEIISEMIDCDPELVDALVRYLSSHFDQEMPDGANEVYYDVFESIYSIRVREDPTHRYRWEKYCETIKHGQRFLNTEAKRYLDEIFDRIALPDLFGGRGILIKTMGDDAKADQFIYRARDASSGVSRKEIYSLLPSSLGAPPRSLRKHGRMNAAGISAFYGCLDPETTVAELRIPVGGKAVVGKFKLLRPIRVLDVPALERWYEQLSYFESDFVEKHAFGRFVRSLHNEIRKPVLPESESLEYLPTQFLAEYIANQLIPNLDGVLYSSALTTKAGLNIVLFQRASAILSQNDRSLKGRSDLEIIPTGAIGERVRQFGSSRTNNEDETDDEDPSIPIVVTGDEHFIQRAIPGNDLVEGFGDEVIFPTKIEGDSEIDYREPTLALVDGEVRIYEVLSIDYKVESEKVFLFGNDSGENWPPF
jgi:hypothetical protein